MWSRTLGSLRSIFQPKLTSKGVALMVKEQTIKESIQANAELFKKDIWPHIKKEFDNGELLSLEIDQDNEILETLDLHAGIDAVVLTSAGVVSLALRIIKCRCTKDNFVIRYEGKNKCKAEYHKKLTAIMNNTMIPKYVIQANMVQENNRFVYYVGVCKTIELIKYFYDKLKQNDTHNLFIDVPNGKLLCVSWQTFKRYDPENFFKEIKIDLQQSISNY